MKEILWTKKTIWVLWLILASFRVWGQSQPLAVTKDTSEAVPYYYLKGTIYDAYKKRIKKATVWLTPLNRTLDIENGTFSEILPKGTYHISTRVDGYFRKDSTIVLKSDTLVQIQLTAKNNAQLLSEVTVLGRKKSMLMQKRNSMESINKQIVERIPAIFGEKDLVKSLQFLPGINSAADGSSEINIRGGSQDQNLLLFNQIPLYNSSHLFGMFSGFNPLVSDYVHVYKGSQPAKYGGKVAATLDINTLQPTDSGFFAHAELGLLSAKTAINIPVQRNKSALLIGGRRTFFDILANAAATEGTILTLFFGDFDLVYLHHLNKKNKLTLSAHYDKDKFYQTKREGDVYKAGGLIKSQLGSSLVWDSDINASCYHKAIFYYSQYQTHIEESRIAKYREYNGDPYSYVFNNEFDNIGIKDIFNFKIKKHLNFNTGFEWTHQSFRPSDLTSTEFGTTSTAAYPTLKGIITASAFAEMDYTFLQKWTVSAGLRSSHYINKSYTYTSLEPRINLSKNMSNDWTIKASFDRVLQPTHRLYNMGLSMPIEVFLPSNMQLKPQIGYQTALGTVYHRRIKDKAYSFSLDAYHRITQYANALKDGYEVYNLVASNHFYTTSSEEILLQGKNTSYGFETMVEKLNGRLSGWLNYSYMRSKESFGELDNGKYFTSPRQRQHSINLFLHYQLGKKVGLSSTWTYQSGVPFSQPSSLTTAFVPKANGALQPDTQVPLYDYNSRNMQNTIPYHRFDINLKYSFKIKRYNSALNFGVFNAYNRANTSFYHTSTGAKDALPKVYSISVLPILPSISFEIKFR